MIRQNGHSYQLLNYKIFSEELALIHRNYLGGLFAFTLICSVIGYLVYKDTYQIDALVWLACITFLSIIYFIRYCFFRSKNLDETQKEANMLVLTMTIHGIVFAYSAFSFLPNVSPAIFSFIVICYAGLVSASTMILSFYPPMFFGFIYPTFIGLFLNSQKYDSSFFFWFCLCAIIYILIMTFFVINTKRAVNHSIKLQFENQSLVHELRQALTQTDDANRAKSIFLASASHDLRQPLHALGLLTETLGRTELNKQQVELHDHMMSSIESTRTMLDSLLNISKLDAGAISPEPKPFFIQTIFNKLEEEIAPTADQQGLIYRSRETIAAANSDALIVELILRNLIANAIRYSKDGGLLIACRYKKKNKLMIEVWDTGIGIPKLRIKEVFTPFHQLNNSERDSTKGFGLGLAISQGLAKTIDSKITVSSKPGRGTVFRFELEQSKAKVIEDSSNDSPPVHFKGKQVLIIDDDERVRASMYTLMKSWDCDSIVCDSAAEALKKISDKKIDIILVDYRLRNGLTGRHAIDSVRKALGFKVPAIIITGDTAAERIKEAQAVDAMLMHKPASTRQLRRMMNTLLTIDPE